MNVWAKQGLRNAVMSDGVAVDAIEGFPNWAARIRPLNKYNERFKRAALRIAAADPTLVDFIAKQREPGYVESDADAQRTLEMEINAFAEACVIELVGVHRITSDVLLFTRPEIVEALVFFPDLYAFLRAFAENDANFPAFAPAAKEGAIRGNSLPVLSSVSAHGGNTSGRSPETSSGEKSRQRRRKS